MKSKPEAPLSQTCQVRWIFDKAIDQCERQSANWNV